MAVVLRKRPCRFCRRWFLEELRRRMDAAVPTALPKGPLNQAVSVLTQPHVKWVAWRGRDARDQEGLKSRHRQVRLPLVSEGLDAWTEPAYERATVAISPGPGDSQHG